VKGTEDFSITGILITVSLVSVLFFTVLIIGVEKTARTENLNKVKIDETTGCEYLIVGNSMIPRLDETGTKVKGCKEPER